MEGITIWMRRSIAYGNKHGRVRWITIYSEMDILCSKISNHAVCFENGEYIGDVSFRRDPSGIYC